MVPQQSDPPSPIDTDDEEALVARLRFSDDDGARRALEELYRRYVSGMLRFVYGYVRSQAAAEDVVSDVFLTIWTRRALWEPKYGVRTYLFTSAQRRAINVYRAEQRAVRWHGLAALEEEDSVDAISSQGEETSTEMSPEEGTSRTDLLKRALETLSGDARRIAELRWRDGIPPAEIAMILGINRAAVDNRLSRLVKRLRAIVEQTR